jgi:hypothetical protein
MIFPQNVQLWKLFLAKGDTSDTFELLVMGVIWHGDFISGVEKDLTPCGMFT